MKNLDFFSQDDAPEVPIQDPMEILGHVIKWPEPGLESRKVISRSNHGHTFRFSCSKAVNPCELESTLEYDLATLLEASPDVLSFQTQPFKLTVLLPEGHMTMFPDFLVHLRAGPDVVVEVKPKVRARTLKYMSRFRLEAAALGTDGFGFKVMTEDQIRRQPRLRNALMIRRHRVVIVPPLIRVAVIERLLHEPATAAALVSEIVGLTFSMVMALAARGMVGTDMHQVITPESLFFAVTEDTK
jgi:hypothetical protein